MQIRAGSMACSTLRAHIRVLFDVRAFVHSCSLELLSLIMRRFEIRSFGATTRVYIAPSAHVGRPMIFRLSLSRLRNVCRTLRCILFGSV